MTVEQFYRIYYAFLCVSGGWIFQRTFPRTKEIIARDCSKPFIDHEAKLRYKRKNICIVATESYEQHLTRSQRPARLFYIHITNLT